MQLIQKEILNLFDKKWKTKVSVFNIGSNEKIARRNLALN